MRKFYLATIITVLDICLLIFVFALCFKVFDARGETRELPLDPVDSRVMLSATSLGPGFWVDTTVPVISGVAIINIIDDSATITWFTDELTNALVEYGLTDSYELGTVSDLSNYGTSHSLTIIGLEPGTTYHFRAHSTDFYSNVATSSDYQFTTTEDVDTVPPVNIMDFLAGVGNNFIALSWTNPSDPDLAGILILRNTDHYPTSIDDGVPIYDSMGFNFIDKGVVNGVTYYYAAFAYDFDRNYASGAITSGMPYMPVPIVGAEEETDEAGSVADEEIIGLKRVPEKERLTFHDVQYAVAKDTLIFLADQTNNKVTTLQDSSFKISLSSQVLSRNVVKVMASINPKYLLRYNSKIDAWEAVVPAPKVGKHTIKLTVDYEDNFYDEISVPLIVEPFGYIYEKIVDESGSEKFSYIGSAKVTLYGYNKFLGKWEIFRGANYKQINPWITDKSGRYAFMVPNGRYYIEVFRAGYQVVKTSEFKVNEVIINQDIKLFKELQFIMEEKEGVEAVAQITEQFSERVTGAVGTFREREDVKEVTTRVATPALSAAATATALAIPITSTTSILGLLNLQYIFVVLIEPIRAIFRKKRTAWGIIYDSLSKQPVSLVILRLIDNKTKKVVQTTVTDKEGRYSFLTKPGEYYITITKPGYKFPSEYLKNKKTDFKYVDLYHGEVIKVTDIAASLAANIPIDAVKKDFSNKRVVLNRVIKGFQSFLSVAGSIITLVFFIFSPSKLLFFLLVLNVGMFIAMRFVEKRKKPSNWGIIYDKNTKKPIKNAIVRIYDLEYNRLLETKVTDENGRYGFMVGSSVYYLTAMKSGYEPSKTSPIDLRKEKESLVSKDMSLIKCGSEGCKVVMDHLCDDKGCRIVVRGKKAGEK